MDETDWMDETYQWMGGTDGTEETGRRDGTDGPERLKDGIDGMC